MLKLLQGFRDFIMRGNVVDLAVGIVIGAAFTGLVTNFTAAFIEPLIKVFSGGSSTVSGGSFNIHGVEFQWSSFVNALVAFLITSSVLYFLVVTPMNMLAERRRRGVVEKEPKLPSDEVKLLMEIRDALVAAGGVPGPRPAGDQPAPAKTSAKASATAPATASAKADAKAPVKTDAPVAQRRRGTGGTTRR